jgi:hypothetical protein
MNDEGIFFVVSLLGDLKIKKNSPVISSHGNLQAAENVSL